MSKQLKLRRGTTAQHSTFTGAEGEVTVDTTKDTLVVHDGVTPGGKPVLSASDGAVGTSNIADGAITSAKIADGAIATADVADGAITSAKIADGTIVTGDLADNAVATAKIAANAVTLAKLARVGTAGQVLTSGGPGADPYFQTPSSGGVTSLNGQTGTVVTTTNFGIGAYIVAAKSSAGTVNTSAGETIGGGSLICDYQNSNPSFAQVGFNVYAPYGTYVPAAYGTWRAMQLCGNGATKYEDSTYKLGTLWCRVS